MHKLTDIVARLLLCIVIGKNQWNIIHVEVNKYGINVKCMHANQLFKLLTTIKRSMDDRRIKHVDLSD